MFTVDELAVAKEEACRREADAFTSNKSSQIAGG